MADEIEALFLALDAQLEIVRLIGPDDLAASSLCEGWSVRDVLSHSLGTTIKFTEFASGATDEPHAPTGDLLGARPPSAFAIAAGAAHDAWAHADLDRRCRLPFGEFSSRETAAINCLDVVTHTGDAALPVGLAVPVPNEVVDVAMAAAERIVGESRDARHYGAARPVREGAPAIERLLGFLGRALRS